MMYATISMLLVCFVTQAYAQSKYFIGAQGQSCNEVCFSQGMNCNPRLITNNNTDLFQQLGINCQPDTEPWWAPDQPSYCSGTNDPNFGKCLGYVDVPGGIQCSGHFPTTQRLCNCDAPSYSKRTFGTGYSGGTIDLEEKWIFEHFVAPGDIGVLTHFWTTYGTSVDDGVIIRYYIDGETNASIVFTPSMACGVGFYDTTAPWGTEWFGKGAADAGWFNNFRIPFQQSIVITTQHMYGTYGGFYIIVRGATNVPITVGGIALPSSARMNLIVTDTTFQPLDWVPIVNIQSGPGVHWMHTLAVSSGNLNFLEGCYHAYFNGEDEFPGTVMSTGTEDYFDSAWYFNAGEFRFDVSGFTHYNQNGTVTTWSAYRFHDQDPLFFDNGFQFVWRNGDMLDASGTKCMIETGGRIVGSPTASEVLAYAWVYTWPSDSKPSNVIH